MNITIVYQYFQGHGEPGHSLVYEYAHHLAGLGHRVTVVAGETGYMRRGASPLPWLQRLFRRERDGDVDVIRTFTYSELHRSYLGRLMAFVSFSIGAPIGLMVAPRPDVVFASSPPLFPMYPAMLASRLRGAAFVFEVRDLWPASAVQLGIVGNPTLIRLMAWMERALYDAAQRIVALTQGIHDDIVARGWPDRKVVTVNCGVDVDSLYPDAEAGRRLREERGWRDARVVMYFGAIGEANNVPVLLRAADRLRETASIRFVIVGDGIKRAELLALREALGLTNVEILAPVAKDQARRYLNAADLCVVTLRDLPLFEGAIPTKLLDYMACARPVLCGVRGEARAIVEAAGAGTFFEPDDDRELARQIETLVADPAAIAGMGERGRDYVVRGFDARVLRSRLAAELVAAAGERSATRRGAQ